MSVQFENYSHSFKLNEKPVFAPSKLGRRIGLDIKDRVERGYAFKDFYYHLRKGGHVAGLHSHRPNRFFCKLDVENFFYSIGRNRVVRSLRSIDIPRSSHYGKWSCVKNPFEEPSYSLPYGFVQSPILASLVLSQSELGVALDRISNQVNVAVYVDDITVSSNSLETLKGCFDELLEAFHASNLSLNLAKSIAPCEQISVFNCSLSHNNSFVEAARIAQFHNIPRSQASIEGFARYCHSVTFGNS